MDNYNDSQTYTYNSLKEIQLQKRLLLKDIRSDNKQISNLWGNLFRRHDDIRKTSRTKRINMLMSSGTSILDGLILGWKLYRKFIKK
jgi:hypothetical protein